MIQRSLTFVFFAASLAPSLAGEQVGYNADVRPILSDKCFLCHGPDKASTKAGLRLDTPERAFAALKDSPGKHAIVAGSLEKSEAWRRIISTDPDEVMPTPKSKLPTLTDSEKRIIARWIEQGAEYEPHWSFVNLPTSVPVPKIKNTAWPLNAIDNFVGAKLEAESLVPSPAADPTRWFRRVSFDLTGLPPTLSQLDQFKNDLAADPAAAKEKAVEAFLATPAYGEHMTLDWLDAARYADTWGYHSDMTFTAWPYRDWVVKAFQDDMPYDQFVTWNIAGDLLPNANQEQKLATAFNRFNRMTNEGGSTALEFRVDGVADRVNTVGTSILGLTFECAKCHDHKYDPILTKDYYQLYAFFNSINEDGLYIHQNISPPPSVLLPTPKQEADLAKHQIRIDELEKQLAQIVAQAKPAFQEWKSRLTPESPLTMADQTALVDFNKSNKKPLESRIQAKDAKPISISLKTPNYVEGPARLGTAVALNGDFGADLPGVFVNDRYNPFTLGLWAKDTLQAKRSVVIAHRCHGTEIGYHGIDLRIEDGYLSGRIFRAWPDNGIGIRSVKRLPKNEWHHITYTYDGQSKAAGLKIYLDGDLFETIVTGDKLYKSVNIKTYTAGTFTLGAIFRGPGFKGGHVDQLTTFDRPLTPIEVRQLAGKETALSTPTEEELFPYYLANHHLEYRKTIAELSAAHKRLVQTEDGFIEVPVMEEMDKPRPSYILARGEFNAKRTEENKVSRDSPSFLLPFPKDAPRDRLGLAQWLTQPNHPLTSRVYVNRIWQQFFGKGLVGTTENFGLQGDLPTHPELLDWLSRDLVNHKWSTKHLVKRIALSATYSQRSALTPELQSRDISNNFLARGPSHRLSGEAIRDSALLSSGLLSTQQGGPPVRPYDPLYNAKPNATHTNRRSLYSFWRRTKPQNNMLIFDKPSLEICSVKRSVTNSPTQALVLLNDPQFTEAARHLATSLMKSEGTDEARIKTAWKKVTSNEVTDSQLHLLTEILNEQKATFKENPESAKKLCPSIKGEDINQVKTAALTVTCQAIYNTDAAIWKR